MQYTALFGSQVSRFTDDGQMSGNFKRPIAHGRLISTQVANSYTGDVFSGGLAGGGVAVSSSGGGGAGISTSVAVGGSGAGGSGGINIGSLITIVALIALTIATKGAAAPKLAGKLAGAIAPKAVGAVKKVGTTAKKVNKAQNAALLQSINKAGSKAGRKTAKMVMPPGAGKIGAWWKKAKKKFGQFDADGNIESDARESQPPQRVLLQSSNIKAAMYDPETAILNVQFLSGAEYTYDDVPEPIFKRLIHASSHGSYFYWNIRGAGVPYPYFPPYGYMRVK